MCDAGEIIQICVKLIRARAENKYIITKVPSDKGNPSVYVILRSFPLNFHSCLYMIACFHKHLVLEFQKSMTCVRKSYRFLTDCQFALRAILGYEHLSTVLYFSSQLLFFPQINPFPDILYPLPPNFAHRTHFI